MMRKKKKKILWYVKKTQSIEKPLKKFCLQVKFRDWENQDLIVISNMELFLCVWFNKNLLLTYYVTIC